MKCSQESIDAFNKDYKEKSQHNNKKEAIVNNVSDFSYWLYLSNNDIFRIEGKIRELKAELCVKKNDRIRFKDQLETSIDEYEKFVEYAYNKN